MTLYLKMVFPQHDILFSELWFRSEFPLDGSLISRNTVFFSCQAREKLAWLPHSCLGESPWCLCLTSVCACACMYISCSLWTAGEMCFVGLPSAATSAGRDKSHLYPHIWWAFDFGSVVCTLLFRAGTCCYIHWVFCGTCFILLSLHVPFGRAPFYPSCCLPVCSQGCLNPRGGISWIHSAPSNLGFRVRFCQSY